MKKLLTFSLLSITLFLIATIGLEVSYKESPFKYEFVEKITVDDGEQATVWLEYGAKIFDGVRVVYECKESSGEEIVLETSGNYELYAYVKK